MERLNHLICFQFDQQEELRTYQRCRAPDNPSLVVVLGSMARADELVLSGIPWDNTTKVGAYSIDAIACKSSVILHNKIGSISLKFARIKEPLQDI